MGSLITRIIAAFLIIALLPIIIVLAFCVFVTMGSPVVFRQERSGLCGKPFVMFKLRTMHDERTSDGALLPDDLRVSSLGRFLRYSRLDELPGLANIVAGDLAFVGPRPLMPETIAGLGERGIARGRVRPGLTGWSQVNGNTRLSLDRKIDLDLWYVENESWLLNVRILARTMLVMVFGERETQLARTLDQTRDETSR